MSHKTLLKVINLRGNKIHVMLIYFPTKIDDDIILKQHNIGHVTYHISQDLVHVIGVCNV